jgi:uncharacterized protein (TIGR03067 family)
MRGSMLVVACALAALLVPTQGSPPDAQVQDRVQEKELAALQGNWVLLRHEESGKVVVDDNTPDDRRERLTIKGDRVVCKNGGTIMEGKVVLDATKNPKHLDLQFAAGHADVIIYVRAGNFLIFCGNRAGKARPTEFASGTEKGGEALTVWKMEK